MAQKPGERANRSGQYEIVGPRGGRTGEERTVVKNQHYVLVDPTKHKSGK